MPRDKEIDSKRSSSAIYVDYFVCPKVLPKWKVFQCPMIADDVPRYKANPKDWSELSFEVNRGKLRMEVYIKFLSFSGSPGGMVLNFFGGLKPIAAALMHDFNVFNYMDSAFINTLEPMIDRVRQLRLADFEDEDEDNDTHYGQIRPERVPSPPMLLVSFRKPIFSLAFTFSSSFFALLIVEFQLQEDIRLEDDMDIDVDPLDEAEDEVVVDDDESEEAPSEQDTDDAVDKVESTGHEPPSDDEVAICQTPMEEPDSAPHAYEPSPLQAKTLDFATSSEAHLDEEEDDAQEPRNEEGHEHGHDDDHPSQIEHDDDHDHPSQIDATPPSLSDADNETRPPTPPSPPKQVDEPAHAAPIMPIPPTSDVGPSADADTPKKTSRGSGRGSKDRHKRRHKAPVEPPITEAALEEKMMGILGKALPGLLSSLLKDAMAQAMPSPQTLPPPAASPAHVPLAVEVPKETLGRQDPLDQVDLVTPQQTEPALVLDDTNQKEVAAQTDIVEVELPLEEEQPADNQVRINVPDLG